LIEIDKYMRRMNFLPDAEEEIKKLEPETARQLQAYANGINAYLSENKTVYELRLFGYHPDPWRVEDCLLIGKVFGFIGLADAQAAMEKFLIQLIQKDLEADKIKALFPYLTEEIDYDLIKKIKLSPPLIPEAVKWLDKLPGFSASNNWAVSGKRTASGKPILCGDPHLEVNRLPAIWQEIVMILPDNKLTGVSIPGVPGLALGRTRHIAWSATYSFMDMLDYRIEHCRDGKYKREDGWKDFHIREEIINVKKGRPIHMRFYENEHGILEGDPNEEGHYLVLSWSARNQCGADDYNALLNFHRAKSVKTAMALFKRFDCSPFNWVVADTDGNIGYQMSGRLFNRPTGTSGLLPVPGWQEDYDSSRFIEKELLPSAYNPDDGILVTANQDLNDLGDSNPINLPMGTYRAERIRQRLEEKENLDTADMQSIHFDLYSIQAERLMTIIRPLLPDTDNGRILKNWDLKYESESKGATLFESVYHALINIVFGDNGFGRQPKEKLFRQAIDAGLSITPERYGATRKVMFAHLLFGGQIPAFLGYDYGPVELPGSRATIPQGQIFKSAGRTTTFSPSYRIIADMSTPDIRTNIAGGPTDRRFSRWYTSDIENWMKGKYKVL